MNILNVRGTLVAARALIADPEHWTQRAYARSASLEAVNVSYPEAVCFCTIGAIRKAVNYHLGALSAQEALYAENELYKHIPQVRDFQLDVANFNDTHSHKDVLSLFDRTIADLDQQIMKISQEALKWQGP